MLYRGGITIKQILLSSSKNIPEIGFGLWQVKDQEQLTAAVHTALDAGYTHFDSAQIYKNEAMLAKALSSAGTQRKDVFITTKIWTANFPGFRLKKSFESSLKKLDTDYVDLLLLHFPVTVLRHHAWADLESLYKEGKAKSIGVSNYTVRHLKQLLEKCEIKPAINQVELHVFLQQPELLAYCHDNDIVVEAYSPLAHGNGMDDRILLAIAKKHGKTPAQVMIRWCLQVGTIPLPKSTTPERIKQNIDVYDFKLDNEDMERIKTLDRNMRTCWDPTHTP